MNRLAINLSNIPALGSSAEGVPKDPAPAGPRAWEEVLWQARRLHRPEENPAQAHPQD